MSVIIQALVNISTWKIVGLVFSMYNAMLSQHVKIAFVLIKISPSKDPQSVQNIFQGTFKLHLTS